MLFWWCEWTFYNLSKWKWSTYELFYCVSIYALKLCVHFFTLSFSCLVNCGSKVNVTYLLHNTTNEKSEILLASCQGQLLMVFRLSTVWIWERTGQNKPLLWLFSQFLHVLTHCISSGPLSYHSNWPFTHFPSQFTQPSCSWRSCSLSGTSAVNMSREP